MNMSADIDLFVKSPDSLIDLCREVVNHLEGQLPKVDAGMDFATMEAQLREIAKTIDRLEKMAVPIPEVLRAEKTRLAAILGTQDGAKRALSGLADSLGQLVREIRVVLQHQKPAPSNNGEQLEREPLDRLSRSVLREAIVLALKNLGGSGSRKHVLECMETAIKDKFLPGDLHWQEGGREFSWQRSSCKERTRMIEDGLLKSDSLVGIWELSEEYK
mgnify:CR=1 FL=1